MSFLRESYVDAPIWRVLSRKKDNSTCLLIRRVFRELDYAATTVRENHDSLSPNEDPDRIWANAVRINCSPFDRRREDLIVSHAHNAKKVREFWAHIDSFFMVFNYLDSTYYTVDSEVTSYYRRVFDDAFRLLKEEEHALNLNFESGAQQVRGSV